MDYHPFFRMPSLPTKDVLPDCGLQELIQLISNVTEAFTTALFLIDFPQNKLRLEGYHSLSLHIDPETCLQIGDSLIGWVAKNQKAVNISQFDRDTRNLKLYLRDEKIKSFLAVPVGELGVLCIDSKRNYVFTEKDQKILQTFACLVLQILQAQISRRGEQNQAKILDFIKQINALSHGKQDLTVYYQKALNLCRLFTGTDMAFFILVPQKGDRYKVVASEGTLTAPLKKNVLAVDMGLTGWVIRENRPLVRRSMKPRTHKSYVFFPEDPCVHFQSYMGIPLSFFGKLYGVMNLVGHRENHWPDEIIQAVQSAGQTIITSVLYLMNL
ncbi:MAG TPA: GAF domain-containing protein [Thermodesulfobacteriota bacterium]|nr:GAF domain-containing protein [Thermodesulfobacteriota bacterium]